MGSMVPRWDRILRSSAMIQALQALWCRLGLGLLPRFCKAERCRRQGANPSDTERLSTAPPWLFTSTIVSGGACQLGTSSKFRWVDSLTTAEDPHTNTKYKSNGGSDVAPLVNALTSGLHGHKHAFMDPGSAEEEP